MKSAPQQVAQHAGCLFIFSDDLKVLTRSMVKNPCSKASSVSGFYTDSVFSFIIRMGFSQLVPSSSVQTYELGLLVQMWCCSLETVLPWLSVLPSLSCRLKWTLMFAASLYPSPQHFCSSYTIRTTRTWCSALILFQFLLKISWSR